MRALEAANREGVEEVGGKGCVEVSVLGVRGSRDFKRTTTACTHGQRRRRPHTQRAALQEAVEALKAELAEATEKGEAAAKDAARAAQVLSDLGEQVRCVHLLSFWIGSSVDSLVGSCATDPVFSPAC